MAGMVAFLFVACSLNGTIILLVVGLAFVAMMEILRPVFVAAPSLFSPPCSSS
jgi:hypothetical protein